MLVLRHLPEDLDQEIDDVGRELEFADVDGDVSCVGCECRGQWDEGTYEEEAKQSEKGSFVLPVCGGVFGRENGKEEEEEGRQGDETY